MGLSRQPPEPCVVTLPARNAANPTPQPSPDVVLVVPPGIGATRPRKPCLPRRHSSKGALRHALALPSLGRNIFTLPIRTRLHHPQHPSFAPSMRGLGFPVFRSFRPGGCHVPALREPQPLPRASAAPYSAVCAPPFIGENWNRTGDHTALQIRMQQTIRLPATVCQVDRRNPIVATPVNAVDEYFKICLPFALPLLNITPYDALRKISAWYRAMER